MDLELWNGSKEKRHMEQSGFLLAGMLYRRDIKSLFLMVIRQVNFLDVVRILMAIKQLSDTSQISNFK